MKTGLTRADRENKIIEELERYGTVSVAHLAEALGVSQMTIRRDLDWLSNLSRVQRIHGGARQMMPQEPEPSILQRQPKQAQEKQAIAQAALALIEEGDVLAIASGSTTLEFARAVAAQAWQRLDIVTNSLAAAYELVHTPGVRLIFVGGRINPDELGTFGVFAEEMLSGININKLFMSCRGIDPQVGLSNDMQAEGLISTARALIVAARQVIVLADHTKFGQVFMLQIIPISQVDMVVTDGQAPQNILSDLDGLGVEVIVAEQIPAG